MKVKKRDGQIVGFDPSKISDALEKAFRSQNVNYDERVLENIKAELLGNDIV